MPPRSTDRVIVEAAARQHGLVTLGQLRRAGVSRAAMRTRIDSGLLVRVHPGVLSLGRPAATWHATALAATLAIGEDAVVGDVSAATGFGLLRAPWRPVHVVAVRPAQTKLAGVVLHRRRALDRADLVVNGGVPTTSLPLTLIDLAASQPAEALARAVERVPRMDVRTMRRVLDRHAGRAGTRRLDDLVRTYEDRTRSRLERRFLALCRRSEIPKPMVNVEVAGHERDFVWPGAALVIEADGHAFHSSRAQRAHDAQRDVAAGKAGWRVHRFTYEQIVLTPASAAADVQALLRAVPRGG